MMEHILAAAELSTKTVEDWEIIIRRQDKITCDFILNLNKMSSVPRFIQYIFVREDLIRTWKDDPTSAGFENRVIFLKIVCCLKQDSFQNLVQAINIVNPPQT